MRKISVEIYPDHLEKAILMKQNIMKKFKVGILGATGMVGQKYIVYLKTILGLRLYIWLHQKIQQAYHTKNQLKIAGI
jgi:hypothetical protein